MRLHDRVTALPWFCLQRWFCQPLDSARPCGHGARHGLRRRQESAHRVQPGSIAQRVFRVVRVFPPAHATRRPTNAWAASSAATVRARARPATTAPARRSKIKTIPACAAAPATRTAIARASKAKPARPLPAVVPPGPSARPTATAATKRVQDHVRLAISKGPLALAQRWPPTRRRTLAIPPAILQNLPVPVAAMGTAPHVSTRQPLQPVCPAGQTCHENARCY
jgi:hypothetical protein